MIKIPNIIALVTMLSLGSFNASAKDDSQYRAFASHYASGFINNHKYEVLSVHIKDRNSPKEYFVDIKIKDGVWVGSPVRLKDNSNFSDRQQIVVLQDVPKETQQEILKEVANSFDRLKENKRTVDVLDVGNSGAQTKSLDPAQANGSVDIFNLGRNGYRQQNNSSAEANDAYRRAAQHSKIMSDAASRLQRERWSADRHFAQQEEIQQKIASEREFVRKKLEHSIEQSERTNSFQKADIAYVLYKEFQRIDANEKENGFESEIDVSQSFEYVNLDQGLQDQFKNELRDALLSKKWDLAAARASQLYNPWNKIVPDSEFSQYVDRYGILKGPALVNDSINIAKLAENSPYAAYRLLKAANQLQATINKQPYYTKIGKTSSIIKSTNVLMTFATSSGSEKHIDQAASVADYFSGKPSTFTVSQNEKGLISFTAGKELKNILNGSNGEVHLGKAVYNELAQNLSWLADPNNKVVVMRNSHPSVDLVASVKKFIGQIDSSGDWLNKNRQKYPVQIPDSLRFTNTEFNKIYSAFATQGAVDFPLQKDAREKSIAAFVISEALSEIQSNVESVNWADIGYTIADIGLGFVPVVSTTKDVFELVVGRNLVTGDILSTEQRTYAALGVITFGIGSKVRGVYDSLTKAKKIFGSKSANAGIEAAVDVARDLPIQKLDEILQESRTLLRRTENEFNVISKRTSEAVNSRYNEPAYWHGLSKEHAVEVLEVETKQPTLLARVSNMGNQIGHWLLKPDDIKGLSPLQIKEKFNLPSVPSHVEVVQLPPNIRLNIGVVGPNKFGNNVGPLQFEILEERDFVRKEWKRWVAEKVKEIEVKNEI